MSLIYGTFLQVGLMRIVNGAKLSHIILTLVNTKNKRVGLRLMKSTKPNSLHSRLLDRGQQIITITGFWG